METSKMSENFVVDLDSIDKESKAEKMKIPKISEKLLDKADIFVVDINSISDEEWDFLKDYYNENYIPVDYIQEKYDISALLRITPTEVEKNKNIQSVKDYKSEFILETSLSTHYGEDELLLKHDINIYDENGMGKNIRVHIGNLLKDIDTLKDIRSWEKYKSFIPADVRIFFKTPEDKKLFFDFVQEKAEMAKAARKLFDEKINLDYYIRNNVLSLFKSKLYDEFLDEVSKQEPKNPDEAIKWMEETNPYDDEKFIKFIKENYKYDEIKEAVNTQKERENNNQIANDGNSRPKP